MLPGTVGAGGPGVVVTTNGATDGIRVVSLVWPGKLGKPALLGTTATYANLQPGVDLVVQAAVIGRTAPTTGIAPFTEVVNR